MASSEPKTPKVLLAPTTPLWFHVLKWAVVGAFLAFLGAFAVVLRGHLRAVPLADAFRIAAVPLLQHRLEQREWPPPFGFDAPVAAAERYKFAEAWDKAAGPVEVPGEWSFATEGEGPAARGLIVFKPLDPATAETSLRSADQRLDDGRPDTGKFRRRSDGSWALSLAVE
jgi:hypothetical protein